MKKMTKDEFRMPKRRRSILAVFHSSFVIRHLSCLLALCFQLQAATNGTNPAPRPIGLEGQVSVTLPRGDYRPRPLDDRTELILRIEAIHPAPEARHRYDFHYIGLEPGAYLLADYLIRPDGTRPDELGDWRIQVRALLPEDHNGALNAHHPRLLPFIGGYRVALGLIGGLWVAGLVGFALASRKKRRVEAPSVMVPEPTFAERLRPLVEAAAQGQLSAEEQAQLERLCMGYWREKLHLPDQRIADALTQLKAHREAGELLRALERWLHQPGGAAVASEINSLLQPYRHQPTPSPEGGRA